jgi:hypothetical protein
LDVKFIFRYKERLNPKVDKKEINRVSHQNVEAAVFCCTECMEIAAGFHRSKNKKQMIKFL